MRTLSFFLFLASQLLAQINITTFQSAFVQTVTNDQNKTLRYEGKLYFKQPGHLLWIYTKPIKKRIYIHNNKVTVIEPDLEQVVIKNMEEKDLFTLLQKAEKIEKDHYILRQKDRTFHIYLKNGVIKKVRYKDQFDNENVVLFEKPKQNRKIDENIFKVEIDPSYDVVYQ